MIYFDQYDFVLMQGSVFLVGAVVFFAARFYLRDISVVLRYGIARCYLTGLSKVRKLPQRIMHRSILRKDI